MLAFRVVAIPCQKVIFVPILRGKSFCGKPSLFNNGSLSQNLYSIISVATFFFPFDDLFFFLCVDSECQRIRHFVYC